ncbi:unnamed protein product, partial [Phaeothamnion confervicola]
GGGGGAGTVRPQGQERAVGINNPAKLRVLGGTARGRRLESPDVFLRPMMGKVREALYSTLTTIGVFEDTSARFLDLFAGSGSVGIEALSRGAAHVTFVDFSKDCCAVAARNADACGFAGRGRAVCADVTAVLADPVRFGLFDDHSGAIAGSAGTAAGRSSSGIGDGGGIGGIGGIGGAVGNAGAFDVVTLTPPYEEVVYADLIRAVADSPAVGEDTVVVIEYPVELGCLPHVLADGRLVGLRNRRYGRTVLAVYIFRPSGRLSGAQSRPEEFITLK